MLPISNVITGSITGRKNPNVVFAIDENVASGTILPDNKEVIEAAVELLKNRSPLIRRIGEKALLRFGEKGVPNTVRLLDTPYSGEGTVYSAMMVLSTLGKKAIPVLNDTLNDLYLAGSSDYIWNIINTFGLIGKEARGSTQSIHKKLYDGSNRNHPLYPQVIKLICDVLQKIGGNKEIEMLIGYARHVDIPPGLKLYAVKALENIALKQREQLDEAERVYGFSSND